MTKKQEQRSVSEQLGEPVAWWVPKAEQFCLQDPSGERPFAKAWEPLYTTPQQPSTIVRTWVGLNWDDMPEIYVGDIAFLHGAKWAEAKLREKNSL